MSGRTDFKLRRNRATERKLTFPSIELVDGYGKEAASLLYGKDGRNTFNGINNKFFDFNRTGSKFFNEGTQRIPGKGKHTDKSLFDTNEGNKSFEGFLSEEKGNLGGFVKGRVNLIETDKVGRV